jgi:hypothetical protein
MLSPEVSNVVGNGTAQGPNTFSAIVVELSGTIGDVLEPSVIAVVPSLISTSSENHGKKSKKRVAALWA